MKRTWTISLAVALAALILCFVPAAWGQATTSLRGTVTDPSGAAIPNATVQLVNADTGFSRMGTTGAQGDFVFNAVLPGTYTVSVEASGFAKFEQRNVQLLVNLPATLNVKMKIGAASQTVTVTEQAPLLNTTDASLGQTMGSNEIHSLPLFEGNVVQLLTLQPGVVYVSNRPDIQENQSFDTRSGAVNGEHSDQNNITLDGVDVNDQGMGLAFTPVLPVTIDSVQEFRVTTSNYDSQQGRSAGAEVSLVTTGGTNTVHGDAYEINRTALGAANDFFLKDAEVGAGEPNHPPQLVHNVFGASLGGPIQKNRLFFFLSYEGHRFNEATSEVRTIPSLALRDGVVRYPCDPSDPNFSQCTGGTVTGLSGASYPVPAGSFGLGPAQLKQMDPAGVGPSSVTTAFFNAYPNPNDTTVGDGFNYTGFRFAAPNNAKTDWLIGRFDYKLTENGNHTLFWRGSGRDDVVVASPPFLPGQPAENTAVDLSKGFVAGYTAVLTSTLVNNLRYGLTRQSISNAGNSNLPWNFIRGLEAYGVTRTNNFQFPVHNIVDDLSWTKGNHSLGFGANIRLVYNGVVSQGNSFSDGSANASWLDVSGMAGSDSPFNPACQTQFGAPSSKNECSSFVGPGVDPNFANSYDFPLMGLVGMVTEVDAFYNFHVNSNGSGTQLGQGVPVPHHYALYEDELYAQDSWKIRPNLTFNYGLRYLLMTPPWETNGQEVSPFYLNSSGQRVNSLAPWFTLRGNEMVTGVPSNQDPLVSYDLAGRSNGKPDLWPNSNKNFAPRVSFAYSPRIGWLKPLFGEGDKSVIRGGFGMYYDHFGQGMLSAFANGGSFGLSTILTNPAGVETAASAPRITSMNVIPTMDNNGSQIFTPAPPAQFPLTFPNTLDTGGFCICWGNDASIKSPYSYALDLSIQRQLPGDMSLELGYVGHLGHRLLAQDDLAMPLNFTDTGSGVNYFTAATALAKVYRAGTLTQNVTPSVIGPAAQFWENMIQPLQPGDTYSIGSCVGPGGPNFTTDPLQAAYDLFCGFSQNETTALFVLDYFGISGTQVDASGNPINSYLTKFGTNTFFNSQYSSLYAWRSMGFSHYHAAQITLHKRMSHGVRFDLNYTFSRSIDLASDAERVGEWGGLGGNIINAWSPFQLKGRSDYDLTHQINANWTLQLPFGQGRPYASHVGKGMDAIIGGWTVAGVSRWSSGFPVNISTGFQWPTNWQLSGEGILVDHPQVGKTNFSGTFNIFKNGIAAINDFRAPFPGESGQRNVIRGDGFLNTDMNVSKTWKMPYNENHSLQLRWDVFNVFNTKRFDVQSAAVQGNLELDISSSFGNYTNLITQPRLMEFGLRYQF